MSESLLAAQEETEEREGGVGESKLELGFSG